MAARCTPPPRRDDGIALVLVLLFVLVTGVLVTALLSQSFTTFSAARVSVDIENRVYSANGGVDWGIQQIRQGVLHDGEPACSSPSATPHVLTSGLALNGRTVQVTCQVTTGKATGASGWAAFITGGTGSSITTQSGAVQEKSIYGAVYDGGAWGSFSGTTTLHILNGDAVSAGACPATDRVFISPTPPYGCVPSTTVATPPPPISAAALGNLASATPRDPNGVANSASCRAFAPGRYTAAPNLLARTGNRGSNYFRSGVYLFDFDAATEAAWETNLGKAVLVGGIPAQWTLNGTTHVEPALSSAPALAAADGCAFESVGATGGHYGVVLVLGRQAKLAAANQSKVELYSYLDPAAPDSPGLSVLQLQDADWGAGVASAVRNPATAIVSTGLGAQAELAVHGNVYTPLARISAFGTNGSVALFQGGVVAAGLDLQASASVSADSFNVSAQSGPGRRVIRIVATTNRIGTEKGISATAEIELANDASDSLKVMAWTVQQ